MVSVFLADGSFIARTGLKAILKGMKNFRVSDEAANREEFNLGFYKSGANLLIIDHTSADFTTETIHLAKKILPDCYILGITPGEGKTCISETMDSGITGYILKECGKQEIMDAVVSVSRGEKFFCGKILESLVSQCNGNPLHCKKLNGSCDPVKITDREMEIIRHIAEGLTNKEIASRLFLSAHTVHTHRKNIMSKLGVNNTAGIVMYAVRSNLLEPNRLLFDAPDTVAITRG